MGCVSSRNADAPRALQLAPADVVIEPVSGEKLKNRAVGESPPTEAPAPVQATALELPLLPAAPPNEGSVERARLQALQACHMLDTPPERRFDTVCTLVQSIFQVPLAVVGLIDEDTLFLKSMAGKGLPRAKRVHSFCEASLKAPNPTMMVVPDTLQDSRFQFNEFVTTQPYVRFYMGAPLVSSDGYIMGSLGVMDVTPRTFPAELCNLMCNFAELVVRELETDKAEAAKRTATAADAEHRRQLACSGALRSSSTFDEAVLLVDTSAESWPVVYSNGSWQRLTGHGEDACSGRSLWDLAAVQGGGSQLKEAGLAARQNLPFYLFADLGHGVACRFCFHPATRDHISSGAIPLIGIPNFIKAASEAELGSLPVGLYFAVAECLPPAHLTPPLEDLPPPRLHLPGISHQSSSRLSGAPELSGTPPLEPDALESDSSASCTGPNSLVWAGHDSRGTATISSSTHTSPTTSGPSRSSWSVHSFGLAPPSSLGDLKLGPMLGSGAFGRVYRGTWNGRQVAVKIMDSWSNSGDAPRNTSHSASDGSKGEGTQGPGGPDGCDPGLLATSPLELALSSKLRHPNLVSTLAHTSRADELEGWVDEDADDEPGGSTATGLRSHRAWWAIQDYCDHGTLLDAIDRGWLRTKRELHAPVSTAALLCTARDIARALAFLHDHSVQHGDLSATNVLLASDPADPRGFVAKVGDFGLARVLEGHEVKTQTYGTVAYMPPELLEHGTSSRATDVYSFGVLCWEMAACQRAWCGQRPAQILNAKVALGQELEPPPGTHPGVAGIIKACLACDPATRPHISELLQTIKELLEAEGDAS